MPAKKPDKVRISCPHCDHEQEESRTAYSTKCKTCGRYFRVQEVLNPAPAIVEFAPELRRTTCFDCGTSLEVVFNAESTMCKRCGRYVDLHDYHIVNAVSKNFRTRGHFVIELKGHVFNTEAIVGDAVIKGRLLGKLFAEGSLTIYSTANIKGSFRAGCLIIPVDNHFHWRERIEVGSAEIGGELAANLKVKETVILKSTARLFGDVEAGGLVVEDGAVFVGHARIGAKSG